MSTEIDRWLDEHDVCDPARTWARSTGCRTLAGLWRRADMPPEYRIWAACRALGEADARRFACWCVRQVWHLSDDSIRTAVEVAERYAEGAATAEELTSAWYAASRSPHASALAAARESARDSALAAAWAAAWDTAWAAAWDAAWDAAWAAAWDSARDSALAAAWFAARDSARDSAWAAARDAQAAYLFATYRVENGRLAMCHA